MDVIIICITTIIIIILIIILIELCVYCHIFDRHILLMFWESVEKEEKISNTLQTTSP